MEGCQGTSQKTYRIDLVQNRLRGRTFAHEFQLLSIFLDETIRRQGGTLVELLVVIGVIAVALAVLLPAVLDSRASARRIRCGNHLRQIGVALQNYHSAAMNYPVGCLEWRGTDPSKRQLAWSAYLLPYIERSNLSDQLDLEFAFDDPVNQIAAAQPIELYRCPSSLRTRSNAESRALIDYGGVFGERITGPNSPPKGTMLIDKPTRNSQITDGLSNTLIVAEDTKSTQGEWINGNNIFDQAFAINAGPDFENDIRSEHRQGANVCFCDGSVRFLKNSIELKVLAAYCTKSGNELNE